MYMHRIHGRPVASREHPATQRAILAAFIGAGGGEEAKVAVAFRVLRLSGKSGSKSADKNPTRRLLFAAGLIASV
jgi:hypothetical protein